MTLPWRSAAQSWWELLMHGTEAQGTVTAEQIFQPHLFSTMERGMEFMFCRMGTSRSTMAAAKGPSSSGFNFTAISPAHTQAWRSGSHAHTLSSSRHSHGWHAGTASHSDRLLARARHQQYVHQPSSQYSSQFSCWMHIGRHCIALQVPKSLT